MKHTCISSAYLELSRKTLLGPLFHSGGDNAVTSKYVRGDDDIRLKPFL